MRRVYLTVLRSAFPVALALICALALFMGTAIAETHTDAFAPKETDGVKDGKFTLSRQKPDPYGNTANFEIAYYTIPYDDVQRANFAFITESVSSNWSNIYGITIYSPDGYKIIAREGGNEMILSESLINADDGGRYYNPQNNKLDKQSDLKCASRIWVEKLSKGFSVTLVDPMKGDWRFEISGSRNESIKTHATITTDVSILAEFSGDPVFEEQRGIGFTARLLVDGKPTNDDTLFKDTSLSVSVKMNGITTVYDMDLVEDKYNGWYYKLEVPIYLSGNKLELEFSAKAPITISKHIINRTISPESYDIRYTLEFGTDNNKAEAGQAATLNAYLVKYNEGNQVIITERALCEQINLIAVNEENNSLLPLTLSADSNIYTAALPLDEAKEYTYHIIGEAKVNTAKKINATESIKIKPEPPTYKLNMSFDRSSLMADGEIVRATAWLEAPRGGKYTPSNQEELYDAVGDVNLIMTMAGARDEIIPMTLTKTNDQYEYEAKSIVLSKSGTLTVKVTAGDKGGYNVKDYSSDEHNDKHNVMPKFTYLGLNVAGTHEHGHVLTITVTLHQKTADIKQKTNDKQLYANTPVELSVVADGQTEKYNMRLEKDKDEYIYVYELPLEMEGDYDITAKAKQTLTSENITVSAARKTYSIELVDMEYTNDICGVGQVAKVYFKLKEMVGGVEQFVENAELYKRVRGTLTLSGAATGDVILEHVTYNGTPALVGSFTLTNSGELIAAVECTATGEKIREYTRDKIAQVGEIMYRVNFDLQGVLERGHLVTPRAWLEKPVDGVYEGNRDYVEDIYAQTNVLLTARVEGEDAREYTLTKDGAYFTTSEYIDLTNQGELYITLSAEGSERVLDEGQPRTYTIEPVSYWLELSADESAKFIAEEPLKLYAGVYALEHGERALQVDNVLLSKTAIRLNLTLGGEAVAALDMELDATNARYVAQFTPPVAGALDIAPEFTTNKMGVRADEPLALTVVPKVKLNGVEFISDECVSDYDAGTVYFKAKCLPDNIMESGLTGMITIKQEMKDDWVTVYERAWTDDEPLEFTANILPLNTQKTTYKAELAVIGVNGEFTALAEVYIPNVLVRTWNGLELWQKIVGVALVLIVILIIIGIIKACVRAYKRKRPKIKGSLIVEAYPLVQGATANQHYSTFICPLRKGMPRGKRKASLSSIVKKVKCNRRLKRLNRNANIENISRLINNEVAQKINIEYTSAHDGFNSGVIIHNISLSEDHRNAVESKMTPDNIMNHKEIYQNCMSNVSTLTRSLYRYNDTQTYPLKDAQRVSLVLTQGETEQDAAAVDMYCVLTYHSES